MKPGVLEVRKGARTTLERLERRYQMASLEAGGWWYGHGVPSVSEDPAPQMWQRSCRAGDPKVLVGKNIGVRGSLVPGIR